MMTRAQRLEYGRKYKQGFRVRPIKPMTTDGLHPEVINPGKVNYKAYLLAERLRKEKNERKV